MRITLLLALLVLTACAPATRPSREVAATSGNAEANCTARGGHLERVGKLQALRCIVAYADAGKACTDGAQCLGQRCMGEAKDEAAATAVVGRCVATSDPFGCQTVIRSGQAATVCID